MNETLNSMIVGAASRILFYAAKHDRRGRTARDDVNDFALNLLLLEQRVACLSSDAVFSLWTDHRVRLALNWTRDHDAAVKSVVASSTWSRAS